MRSTGAGPMPGRAPTTVSHSQRTLGNTLLPCSCRVIHRPVDIVSLKWERTQHFPDFSARRLFSHKPSGLRGWEERKPEVTSRCTGVERQPGALLRKSRGWDREEGRCFLLNFILITTRRLKKQF